MAYSQIEDKYLSALTAVQFPDAPVADMAATQEMAPGQQPGDILLAMGGNAAGRRSNRPMTDIPMALMDMGAGGARGAAVQTAGLLGDIQMLYNGVKAVFNRPEDQSRLDAFAKGLNEGTLFQTTEQISKENEFRIPGTGMAIPMPPVVPPNAPDAAMRKGSAEYGQAFGEFAPIPGVIEAGIGGAKILGKTAAAGLNERILSGQSLIPGLSKEMSTPGVMFAISPSKFNAKTELPKAIDIVANDPALNVFLPQAERAPSVALRLSKPAIKGTGSKDTLTVADIGLVLEKSQLSLNKGKTLDPTKPKDLVKMVDSATAEAEYQMSQPISGATWYEDDVFQAFALGSKIVPELATDEPLRVMATAFAASTSYNKRASENWSVAMRITEDLMKTGKVPARNPDNGKLWGGTTGPIMEQQLNLHQYMINRMGIDGYSEWLLTPHTVKEISDMKAASGLYKTPGIPGKAGDMKMGAFIMGEKGGAFFLNLNGIKETTADKWFTRTYNRHTGTLTSGPISEQGLVDSPRNESERSIMKVWNRSVAENMKLDEQANQAVLWYYEQSLYYNMGIKSARSESFSDGAKTLLNARGIPFTEAELAGARGRSNAPQIATEPQGTGGARDTVGIRQTAPAQPAAAPTTVTGGRRAPKSGAQ